MPSNAPSVCMDTTSMSKQTSPSTNSDWATEEKPANKVRPRKIRLNRMLNVLMSVSQKTEK